MSISIGRITSDVAVESDQAAAAEPEAAGPARMWALAEQARTLHDIRQRLERRVAECDDDD